MAGSSPAMTVEKVQSFAAAMPRSKVSQLKELD
jgi:hypothetical protein